MAGKAITLKIQGPGLNLSQEISNEVAARVLSVVLGVSTGGSQIESQSQADSSGSAGAGDGAGTSKQSLSELWVTHEAKGIAEKIVGLGVYLRDSRKQDSFTRENLKTEFEAARESVPKNIPRDIDKT